MDGVELLFFDFLFVLLQADYRMPLTAHICSFSHRSLFWKQGFLPGVGASSMNVEKGIYLHPEQPSSSPLAPCKMNRNHSGQAGGASPTYSISSLGAGTWGVDNTTTARPSRT